VFLPFQRWKFWATRSWRRAWPPMAAIYSCPPSQDIKQLHCFLGMVNFYHHFLPSCARILRPLSDLLRGNPKHWSGPLWQWRIIKSQVPPSCGSATSAPFPMLSFIWPLTLPIPTSEVSWSKVQETNSILLGFFFKKLSETESRYSTFDRDLLAAYLSIRYFCHFCEGHPF
jgi:hypothetical protein